MFLDRGLSSDIFQQYNNGFNDEFRNKIEIPNCRARKFGKGNSSRGIRATATKYGR